jgi:dienelactone hydrolase
MKAASFALALFVCACASQTPVAEPPPRGAADAISSTAPLPDNIQLKEAIWYSEQVHAAGRLFLPASAQMNAKAAAVVLAPGEGRTAETLDAYAIALAQNGIVALTIDYRGWGRSGAHLYLGERVDTYDKMRFSEQTPELVFRRGRIDPDHQVQDLRNAITFLQGAATVDPARIGVLGVGLGGGHVVSVMSMDARVKAGVAVTPDIPGQGEEERSFLPDAAMQAEMIRLARDGAPPKTAAAARARNALENRIALAEYKPFWRLDAIPQTAAVRFIVAEADDVIDNAVNAGAAAGQLKGPNDVKSLPGALHELTSSQTSEAAKLAAEWFRQRL